MTPLGEIDLTQSRTRQQLSPMATRLLARARHEWEQQQFEAAERSLTSVLALAPEAPDAIRMLGMVAQRRGNHVKAADCFRRVLKTWPEDACLRIGLGISLYEHGEAAEAIAQLRRACDLAPTSAPAWFNLGEALDRDACTREAVAPLQRALELDPSHRSARLSLTRVQASLGWIEAAVAGYREILKLDPGNAEAWHGLSLNVSRLDALEMECLRRAFARGNLENHDHDLLGFALARALESRGNYARAFEMFQRINSARRTRIKWNAAAERMRVEAIRAAFTCALPRPLDPQLGSEAILIVSMPRSGSTLAEQILASHSQVEGANEIKDMRKVIEAEAERRDAMFPQWVTKATAQDWQRLGNEYLARTARWREAKPRFTDKNLMNWRFTGAALAMLPAARVIIVRRNPVEVCLACFRHAFMEELGFACDLGDTADYCIDFLRLTRFWLEKYPDRVFDLEYEALVTEPETVIRRLLTFCGLPFESACLDSHKTERTVLTPSAAQVRQPIHLDTARSARYGDSLNFLRQRLRDAGVLTE